MQQIILDAEAGQMSAGFGEPWPVGGQAGRAGYAPRHRPVGG